MTRKDFVLIARALASSRMERPTDAQIVQHRFTCNCVAMDLQNAYPRFDRERFLAACGVAS